MGEVYSFEQQWWSRMPASFPPCCRIYHTMTLHEDSLYVFGGCTLIETTTGNQKELLSDVHRLQLDADLVLTLDVRSQPGNTMRAHLITLFGSDCVALDIDDPCETLLS